MNPKSIKSRIQIFILLIGFILLSIHCQKTVPNDVVDSSSFLRVYPDTGNQFCWAVIPTEDKGCLLISSDNLLHLNDAMGLSILKIDQDGKLLWKNKLQNVNLEYPQVRTFKDGSTIINSFFEGNVCKIDKDGKVAFISSFTPVNNTSGAAQSLDGAYHLVSSSGGGSANYSIIKSFKDDGTSLGDFSLTHAKFIPDIKILFMGLLKCDTFGSFIFAGVCWHHWNNNFRNQKGKLFLAKQEYAGNNLIQNKVFVFDSLDKSWSNTDYQQLLTKDNHILLSTTLFDYNSIYKGKLIKLDMDFNIIWELDLQIGEGTSIYAMKECADGSVLITGDAGIGVKSAWQPFVAKVDVNGKMLWKQIYKTPLSGVIGMAVELKDGSLLLGGKTSGVGEGISGDDLTLMKTDKDGNLK